jgi:transposase InsO family protein
MTAQLAVTALRTAVARRQPTGVVVVHSDRGSQFRARSFRAVWPPPGYRARWAAWPRPATTPRWSPGTRCCSATSWTAGRWRTRDELHEAIVFWIEHTYNRRRRQRALGKLTPVEYELAFTTQAAAVAA